MNRRNWITIAACGVSALVLVPLLARTLENDYLLHVGGLVGIYALLCVALNITIGYTGLLDLGFMAFYAVGAYTGALLSTEGVSFWLIVPVAAVVGGLVRAGIGAPVLRLRGDYLAIVTLAFGEIVRLVLNNFDALTNGPKGLPRVGEEIAGLPLGFTALQSTDKLGFYYLILGFLALAIMISYRLEHSRLGRALVAIREDELAAELAGIPVSWTKGVAFTVSGMMGAVGGAIYVHWVGFITPETFTFWESVLLVAMIVLGGIGHIGGVILGAVLLVGLPELLRSTLGSRFVDYRMLLFGFLMIATVIFRPEGILRSRRRKLELSTDAGETH